MPRAVDARRNVAGALALLALACGTGNITPPGNGGPPPPDNHAPVITVAPSASTSPLVEGRATQLSVTADDPDGDSLGYSWTQLTPPSPQGTFSSRTLRNPTWTAPTVSADTPVKLQVTVIDGQGGSTVGSVDLVVSHLVVNQPPVVSMISVSPSAPVAGEVITLSVTASDPEGDPLVLSWMQTAPSQQGTFNSTNQPSVTWISFPLSVSSLDFNFQVTVSDGTNMQQRQVTVTVKAPSYDGGVQPIWTAHCTTSCHQGASPGGSLDLTAAVSWAALVNQPMVLSCTNATRVVPNAPASSGLMNKLEGSSCGTQMPEGAPPLSTGELVTIKSWILGGALP